MEMARNTTGGRANVASAGARSTSGGGGLGGGGGTIGARRRRAATAPMLDADTERALAREAQRGCRRSRDLLVMSHARLALAAARSHGRDAIAQEDLVAQGMLGLAEAAMRFDPDRDVRFSAYAAWWVRALLRQHSIEARRTTGAPSTRAARRLIAHMRTVERSIAQSKGEAATREEVAAAMGVAVEEVERVDAWMRERDVSLGLGEGELDVVAPTSTPEEEVAEREVRSQREARVRRALATLDAREREIVRRRLLADDEETLAAVGARLGLSRERVRQLEARACAKLRAAIAAASGDDEPRAPTVGRARTNGIAR
jgi:RNA polymerase sigma-32 factor